MPAKGAIRTDYLEFLGRMVPIISGLCTVIGALAGWIVSARTSRTKREKAIAKGVLALLRTKIVDAYERYVKQGHHLTMERKDEITRAYEAYTALGGNGAVRDLYEDIRNLPTYIVGEGRKPNA